MKTIFITAYQGFVSRNIFNTDVLGLLRKQNDLRIVLFVPSQSKEFIEKYYGGANIIVEGVDFNELINSNKFWYRLGFILENTRYVRDQRGEYLFKNKNSRGYLNYWWLSSAALILSHLPQARTMYRSLDYRFSPKDGFIKYFDKYKPFLIFATDVFGETDVLLMREAKSLNIPVVGMVRSWDNTTTKGILRLLPKKIIVNSPTTKRELIRLHGYEEENIFVVGLPQFDSWSTGPTETREKFFAKIGADQNNKLILFAPAGAILSDTDWQLCQILKEAINNGSLPDNVQFLVRNHPQHPADLTRFTNEKRFIIESPGSRNKPGDYKGASLSPQENDHLRNSIYYSDIVMYVATSLGLDASIYNKPQILISFDGFEKKPYIKSVRRYNREDCLYNLVKCGGTRVANNREEFLKAIRDYLQDPNLDQPGRDETIKQHLYKIDGRAGERIANYILKFIYERN